MTSSTQDALNPSLTALAALRSSLASLHLSLDGAQATAYDIPVVRNGGSPGGGGEGAEGGGPLQACIDGEVSSQDAGTATAAPVLEGPDEGADLWDRPIVVTPFTGAQGARLCKSALLKITRRRDQPPNRPDRRAGLLWLPGKAGAGARRAARTVNDLKTAFQAAVNGLPFNHVQRAHAFHGTPLQHVLLIQAYRAIQVIGVDYQMDPRDPTRILRETPYSIDAISFSWSGASRKVLRLSRDEVFEYLASRKAAGWKVDWEKRIEDTGDSHYAVVRRLAPFPIANLKIDGKWCKRVMASAPLIYTGDTLPKIRDLPDYQPSNEPGLRNVDSVKIEQLALIPEIGLHRYRYANLRQREVEVPEDV